MFLSKGRDFVREMEKGWRGVYGQQNDEVLEYWGWESKYMVDSGVV